ncbi:MAG: hypothetical protein GY903_09830 [Fuerstiella sp.]|nr:hypothetical protein [Fuerstiella sp.]MCP4854779.1 hypothetical protein [Fuerstiella sp.]
MIRMTHKKTSRVTHRLAGLVLTLAFCVLLPTVIAAEPRSDAGTLEAGFSQPPPAARPSAYWVWLNGYANRKHIDRELKAFADHGVGGLLIFDMGARGDERFVPPTGPAYMSDESLENIAYSIKTAKRYGLDIQLAACSSWDLGGSWVTPEHASMALYRTELRVKGPQSLDARLPFPSLPAAVPRTPDGKPAFSKEVALLAIPETKRLPAHEFVFRLPGDENHKVDHVVLYNTTSDRPQQYGKLHLFSKEFSVAVSTGEPRDSDFRVVVRKSLEPHADEQRFDFPKADARYVRLRIFNGHNPKFDRLQLAEFEAYSTEGRNVVGSHEIDRTRDSAEIVWASSESADGKRWNAANLHDGSKSGALGSWSFAGPPPLVIEDRSRIVNLTKQLGPDGQLKWNVPAGRWTLMRFVCANTGERLKVPSPQSDGLATDHFSAEATHAFIRTITGRLESRLGDLKSSGLRQLYLPSYEVRGAKWTPDFLEQFQKIRHYDMTTYLPVLAGCQVEGEEQTQRFRYDFQKTLGDLLVSAYYQTASEAAHEAGLGIEAEAGGPGPPVHQVPVDALKALGAIDEVRGEFWPWRLDAAPLWVVKETASAAHVYGRPRVHMEAFTGFRHWQDGPFDLKHSADRAFCEGMNHVVWHTSTTQPPEAGKPGWVYGAGTHLTPNLAWWSMAKPFLDYLARCSFMLQRGLFVGDVCYYYGDQGSNFVPPKHIDPSLGYGYDYDVANPQVILDRMTVQGGRITLPDGMRYELLVLPERKDMDLAVLQKIERMVKAGATVVGPKPIRSNGLTKYPQRDDRVRQLADRLWGECDGESVQERVYGKGKIICGRLLRDVLRERGVGPDFGFTSQESETQIDFIHRQTADADIYFVRNATSRPASITATFRVTGRIPELWFPESGRRREAVVYEQKNAETQVPLSFGPTGSVFVVFQKNTSNPHLISHSPEITATRTSDTAVRAVADRNGSYELRTSENRTVTFAVDHLPPAIELKQPWTVHFPANWGAPDSVSLDRLASWTDHEHSGVRNFSGVARYETNFDVPASWLAEDRKIHIDLGQLWAVGRVRLNNKPLGIVWKPPYRVDITAAAKQGRNRLEVEIANTWANRLVGDAGLPVDDRYCRTNITVTLGTPWKDVPLRESGLLGPVRLIPYVERVVRISE